MAVQGTTHLFIQQIGALNLRGEQSAIELERTKKLMEMMSEQIEIFQQEKVNLIIQSYRDKIPDFEAVETHLLSMQKEMESCKNLFKTHCVFLDLLKESNQSDETPFNHLITADFRDSSFESNYKIAQIELATLVDTLRNRIPQFQTSLKRIRELTDSYRFPNPTNLADEKEHPEEWGSHIGKWCALIMHFEELKRKSEIYATNTQKCHQLDLKEYRSRAISFANAEVSRLQKLEDEDELKPTDTWPEISREQALILDMLKQTAKTRSKIALTSYKAFCSLVENPDASLQTYLPAQVLKEIQKITSWLGLTD